VIRFDRSKLRNTEQRRLLLDLLETGLAAVDPEHAVSEALRAGAKGQLNGDSVHVIAIGKAAVSMTRGAAQALGQRLAGGIALTRHGYGGRLPKGVELHEAGHPLPDEVGVRAAVAIQRLCEGLGRDQRVLCLLSGGGSALLASPPRGVTVGDLAATAQLLLESGVAIDEINTVRRHLSTLQGGGLAMAVHPARLVTLILSDVVGDRLESIASGPTVPDPTTFADATRVLRQHGLWDEIPAVARQHLEEGLAGRVPETAKPGDPVFAETRAEVVASNATFLGAVCEEAAASRLRVVREDAPVVGEASDAGRRFGERVTTRAKRSDEPTLIVAGGETTVTVRGDGQGGRNQEFALAAAQAMAGVEGVQIASHATDGTDGTTSAAGAVVDGETIRRGERRGLDPTRALEENDSHGFLAATNDVLWTGPTGTNVADVVLGLIGQL